MNYRPFGQTGLMVSEVGFGAWAIGGNRYGNSYGPTDDQESVRAIGRALELGCTFFDTADVYGHGHSEELLGQALASHRQQVVLATKVGGDFYHGGVQMNFSPEYLPFALEQSLRRLRTDYVDVHQLHNPPPAVVKAGQVFEVLDRLKAQGKIRFAGVSIFEPFEGELAIQTKRVHALQVVYNLFYQDPAQSLFSLAQEQGIAIIAREPLANGLLTGKYRVDSPFPAGDIRASMPPDYLKTRIEATERLKALVNEGAGSLVQLALRFVLAHPAVSVVIPGAKTVKQVEENLEASDGTLPQKTLEAVQRIYQRGFAPP